MCLKVWSPHVSGYSRSEHRPKDVREHVSGGNTPSKAGGRTKLAAINQTGCSGITATQMK